MLVILLYLNLSDIIKIPSFVLIVPRFNPLNKFPLSKISTSVISKLN